MGKKNKLEEWERYDRLIRARNFHYENFNKWVTYFYVANAALLVGYYGALISEKVDTPELILLLLLGCCVSLYWYWSTKGYYYWNINFITLINNHESEVMKLKKEERVYFVFANLETQNDYSNPIRGANVSTSKVAILFSFTVVVLWGTLLFNKILGGIECDETVKVIGAFFLSIISTILISSLVPKAWLYSKNDHFPDLKITQSKE